MGLDQSGVLTVGSLVPKEGGHTLPDNTLLVIPPWCSKPPFFVGSQRLIHQGSPHATNGQQGIHSLGVRPGQPQKAPFSANNTLAGCLQT